MRLTSPRARRRVCRGDPKALDQSDCRDRVGSEPIPLLDGPASSSRGSQTNSIWPGWCCSTHGDTSALSVGLSGEQGRFISEVNRRGLGVCVLHTHSLPQPDLRVDNSMRSDPHPHRLSAGFFLEQTWQYDSPICYSDV